MKSVNVLRLESSFPQIQEASEPQSHAFLKSQIVLWIATRDQQQSHGHERTCSQCYSLAYHTCI